MGEIIVQAVEKEADATLRHLSRRTLVARNLIGLGLFTLGLLVQYLCMHGK